MLFVFVLTTLQLSPFFFSFDSDVKFFRSEPCVTFLAQKFGVLSKPKQSIINNRSSKTPPSGIRRISELLVNQYVVNPPCPRQHAQKYPLGLSKTELTGNQLTDVCENFFYEFLSSVIASGPRLISIFRGERGAQKNPLGLSKKLTGSQLTDVCKNFVYDFFMELIFSYWVRP